MLPNFTSLLGRFGGESMTSEKRRYWASLVRDLNIRSSGNITWLRGTVVQYEAHTVAIQIANEDGELRTAASCTCMAGSRHGRCEHMLAVLYAACLENQKNGVQGQCSSTDSDLAVVDLIQDYVSRARAVDELLQLKVILNFRGEDYPSLSLETGRDTLHPVPNIQQFLAKTEDQDIISLNKTTVLSLRMESFDPWAQNLLRFLSDQMLDNAPVPESALQPRGRGIGPKERTGARGEIMLKGCAFDRLFEVLQEAPSVVDNEGRPMKLVSGNPQVSFSLEPTVNGAWLKVNADTFYFFEDRSCGYAWTTGALYRITRDFQENVTPFLRGRRNQVWIAGCDLPVLCNRILPSLRRSATLEDPQNFLNQFEPEECVPQFYLDLRGSDRALTLELKFKYGAIVVPAASPATNYSTIHRDGFLEENIRQLVQRLFRSGYQDSRYVLTGDDAIYDFLSQKVDVLRAQGEVFVSERLHWRISGSSTKVDIRVSGNNLILDIDTGEFPVEEMEELYQTLLQRRRFYRLKDGRYLSLEDMDKSAVATLAEMSHLLRLPLDGLQQGQVQVPAFRALYLESLAEGSDLKVTRDNQFREMIQRFRSMEENQVPVPECMENVLRPYQKVGFQWLKTLEVCNFGGILADEMGLGKTIELIAYFCTVPYSKVGKSNLVVCPTSLILNWADEFQRFAPHLRIMTVMGTAAERAVRIRNAKEVDVWVTSYELLRQDIESYVQLEFYACVLDEAQHVKNRSTLASNAVKRIVCQQRFVMTGTPIENRLSELWNLFDFLMPGYLFTHGVFVEKLEKPVLRSGDAEAALQLRKMVQPFMLRRLKKDVLPELPPKIEHVRRIVLSEEERKIYISTAVDAKRRLADSRNSGKVDVLAALMRLRQVCCSPQLAYENYFGPNSKMEACMELCTGMVANGHQILLFSQFTSMLDLLEKRLNEAGITTYTLEGSTSKEMRAKLVKDFNAGGANVFLISLKAGGTGLNLTAADVVIHYDPWWNTAAQEQATDRAHRIGQQSVVQVYKLICENSLEEQILELQKKKAALMDTVSSTPEESLASMSREELLALLG